MPQDNEGQTHRSLSILLDQAPGEPSAMDLVDEFTVLEAPGEGPSIPLNRLVDSPEEWELLPMVAPRLPRERPTASEMEP